ncbi:MAG: OmpA family protein [Nocardioides sp.]
MGASTLTHALQQSEADATEATDTRGDGPGIRFLDAIRSGDELGVLDTCGETTTMSAHNMSWSCQGPEEILGILGEARRCFPGLTIEPRTRNVGFGLVIDEVRIQDALFGTTAEDGEATESTESAESPVSEQRTVALWQEDLLTPMRLNLPVRVTVRHDDLQVHEVELEFPAALLKRALGMRVDPLEMSLSEVQSAIIAPVEAEYTTRTLASPGLTLSTPVPPVEDDDEVVTPRPRHRRRRVLVPIALALLGTAAAGGWWVLQGQDADASTAPTTPTSSVVPTAPAASVAPSTQPVVTHAKPSQTPTRKPNVTLTSDLAFSFDSAVLSPQAKSVLDQVAQHVRDAGLTGKIYVDGYTDDLGSATHGLLLSQQRADAVSHYLGSKLVGVPVSIVSTGHGEAHPVADNNTRAGRKANRRVTLTLPTS